MYRSSKEERWTIYFYNVNEDDQMYNFFINFGNYKVSKFDSFKEIFKHSGFALVLFMDIENIRNFDIRYRYKLKYSHVFIYNENVRKSKFNKFSNISILNQEDYLDIDLLIDKYHEEDYEFFAPKKFQHDKLKKLNDIHGFVKEKKAFSSLDVASNFNMSLRNVERYLNDINYLYNDIGYDYVKNEYYVCK